MKLCNIKLYGLTVCLCFFAVFYCFGCAAPGPKTAAETGISVDQQDTRVINSITFIGNNSIKTKKLLKQLDFKVGESLDVLLAESNSSVISEYYQQKGFPDVRVRLDLNSLSIGNIAYIIEEGQRVRIKSIRFQGNSKIKTANLKSLIKTSTRNWLLQPVYYTEEKIAADELRIRTAYYQRGFLNYKVSATGRENIVFTIEEGPQYTVGNISISGNQYYDSETLLDGLELEPGQIYLPPEAASHAQKILDRYLENGFIDAEVTQQHLFSQAGADVVNIEFNINEGQQFRIGRIDIIGNEHTQDKVYRRMLDEYDFSPGELYNAKRAPAEGGGTLERYLQNETMAEEILISPATPSDGAENRKDVRINVKEGLTGLINPGMAVSTDSGVLARFVLTQRNFDISDWPESFSDFISRRSFTGAGQILRISLEPGTEDTYYSIEFIESYFQDKPVRLKVVGSNYQRWYESYDERRTRGYIEFRKRYKSGWRNSLGFRVENVNVDDLDYDAPQEIIDVKGDNVLYGANVGIELDKTNDIYTPSDGYNLELSYEQVTGDFDFSIFSSSVVMYTTLYEDFLKRKTVLATKILYATIFSDAPAFEKLYAGGIGTYGIRGFGYRGISPRGLQTAVADPYYKDPVGSDSVFIANTELTVPLIGENISGLLFLDSGTVETGDYRSSVGAGLQIMIPYLLGPVPMRFSYAVPLSSDEEDDEQSFSFFMGRLF